MTDAIKPAWAISVWANSDHIYAELPAINGHTAHVVRLPRNEDGFSKLLVLAKARDLGSKLGTKGDPTQFQIDKVTYDPAKVRKMRPKVAATSAQSIGAVAILRRMGLI